MDGGSWDFAGFQPLSRPADNAPHRLSGPLGPRPVNFLLRYPTNLSAGMIVESCRTLEEPVEEVPLDFDRVIALHQRRIYFLALDLTGNHHDAEDLAQLTFLKAYRGLGNFRGEAKLGSWLHRITLNTHIDRQRTLSEAARRKQHSWDDEDDFVAQPRELRPAANPEQRAESATIQKHIRQALEALSPQQRTVFVLRHYQQLKLREIAAELGISEGTVKTVLFRAVRRLRDELSFYRPELRIKETS